MKLIGDRKAPKLHLLCALILLSYGPGLVHAQLSKATEKTALVALYNAVSRPGTSFHNTWDPQTDPCRDKWPGVVCDGDGHISDLSLKGLNMAGTIPKSFYDFPRLVKLDLGQNHITGEIPAGIWFSFPMLSYVDFSMNHFIGTIPKELGDLPDIRYFDITGNKYLEGLLPQRIAKRYEEGLTSVLYRDTKVKAYDEYRVEFIARDENTQRYQEPVFYRVKQPGYD